tara:strand:- start:523 stop:699 length:177 start_codon:yes stop_codon:yes gene_type:complete
MAQTKLYKITKDPDNIENGVSRDDGSGSMSYIPKDPNNSDYAEYLEWVAAGNTAEAAD